MIYDRPTFQQTYGNYIGGQFVEPLSGEYFDNSSPIDGENFCRVARSSADDVERALDAAHEAKDGWGKMAVAERSRILNKIADITEENLEFLARCDTVDNGKPIRETLAADMPLVVDHFRYFASVIRAEEGSLAEHDEHTVAYHVHEPLGVVGQIIPWNFPLLMAAWKIAPALAAGNCTVVKPAEQTPVSIMEWIKLIDEAEILPDGVLNIVQGFGPEAGKPLAQSERVSKVAFTGETTTGRLVMQYAAENLTRVTMELGGKSPNVFFENVMDADDEFFDKCLEGAAMFALNQGEVCTCPSRILVQESIAEEFTERVVERVKSIRVGNPLDSETQVGAQASNDQYEKIKNYFEVGRQEGAEVLVGGKVAKAQGVAVGAGGDGEPVNKGFYIEPTIFRGHNRMRVFQEEIFGPVTSLTTFKDEADAIDISNETLYGLGAGVWTRDMHQAYRVPRAIQAGRVWVNCYHLYPAHAAFGGYKKSGFGRENHKMMLDHYRNTKNMLVSYDKNAMGFF
ncbi:aldehyde dehydrogenase family protein [Longibacter sp.]|uniref:aldehyde dehydrogenase family protein n=1 Tax=Longibacter sp. TaxID=2045415 RepID=UPI003EBDAB40